MAMPTLGRLVAALGLLAAISPAAAETFTMTNGETIEGAAISSLANTLSIEQQDGKVLTVPIVSVQRVDIPTRDGGVLSGKLIGWFRGEYRLATDQGKVEATVEDGVVTALAGEGADDGGGGDQAELAAAPAGPEPTDPEPAVAAAAGAIKAGFVYDGPADDGGRIYTREKGRQALAAHPKVDETTYFEIDSEDEEQVIGAVDQLVADGVNTVFLTGNDSAAATAASAERHEDVRFVHCGPFDPTANVEVVCGRIYQARFLAGMIAGGMTESDLIGYVAAKPTPPVIVGINAFALGAQSINPDASIVVHWTNSWYAPGVAQQRAEELIGRGVDVLTLHQDSPAALQVAERNGIDAIGFQSDMSAFAPSSILTSAVWNWGAMYDQVVEQLNNGDPQLRPSWLGLREGVVGLAPISSRVPDDLKRLIEQAQREMIEGRLNVFAGPIRDTDGDVRILEGRAITDENLRTMDYLVEGVVGF
ncbi:MAG: BMP family ABC transporter substrate-binding protein [Geminicoccaceae bacterium]